MSTPSVASTVQVPDVTTTLRANFEVPTLDRFDVSIARGRLGQFGLRLKVVHRKVTVGWPPGTITRQTPASGSFVIPGSVVRVTVVVPPACDPAYPDFCIPPWLPDLNCADVAPHHDFRVLQPRDPYGFDGNDNDGSGCYGPMPYTPPLLVPAYVCVPVASTASP